LIHNSPTGSRAAARRQRRRRKIMCATAPNTFKYSPEAEKLRWHPPLLKKVVRV
jgi:hypothetical protein